MGANESVTECPICAEDVPEENEENSLRLLPCTHCVCMDCINRIFNEEKKQLRCPFCRTDFPMSRDDLTSLPKKTRSSASSLIERIESIFSREDSASDSENANTSKEAATARPCGKRTREVQEESMFVAESSDSNSLPPDFSDSGSFYSQVLQSRPQRQSQDHSHKSQSTSSNDKERAATTSRMGTVVLTYGTHIRVQTVSANEASSARRIMKDAEAARRMRELEAFEKLRSEAAKRKSKKSKSRRRKSAKDQLDEFDFGQAEPELSEFDQHYKEYQQDYARRAAEQEMRVSGFVDRFNMPAEAKQKISRFLLSMQPATHQ